MGDSSVSVPEQKGALKVAVEHTPGPWWTDAQYSEEEAGCSIIAANTDSGPLPGNPTRGQVAFATMLLPEYAEECKANARLIAAAPDLLEACRRGRQKLATYTSVYPGDTELVKLLKLWDAAIAKARL